MSPGTRIAKNLRVPHTKELVPPIQHFSSFPVEIALLHSWNVRSFVISNSWMPGSSVKGLALVVQRLDNAIHRINHYPVDSVACFINIYPLDSDLSGG